MHFFHFSLIGEQKSLVEIDVKSNLDNATMSSLAELVWTDVQWITGIFGELMS